MKQSFVGFEVSLSRFGLEGVWLGNRGITGYRLLLLA